MAAGGFGGAGGVVLLTGGTALVVIGAGAAVYAVFSYSDQKQDCERIRLMLDDLSHRKSFTSSGMGTRKFQSLVIGKK